VPFGFTRHSTGLDQQYGVERRFAPALPNDVLQPTGLAQQLRLVVRQLKRDVMIRMRSASKDDYDFLWALHRSALRPYVEATWGWDEAWQADYFRAHFDSAHCQIIQAEGVDVSVLSV
jgi:hypothetical protein